MPCHDADWHDRPDWQAILSLVGVVVVGVLCLGLSAWKVLERVGR